MDTHFYSHLLPAENARLGHSHFNVYYILLEAFCWTPTFLDTQCFLFSLLLLNVGVHFYC